MKKINKIKLTSLSKDILEKEQTKRIIGGYTTFCYCLPKGDDTAIRCNCSSTQPALMDSACEVFIEN